MRKIITLIIIISAVCVFAKDFQKTEDIINSILNEPASKKNIPLKKEDVKKEPAEAATVGAEKDSIAMSKADEILLKTGIQQYNSELYPHALKNFEELKSKYGKSPYADSAKVWIGKIRIKEYRYDDAIREFAGIAQDSGEYPTSLFMTGEAYQYKRDYVTAIEYFERVSSQFPQHDLADNAMLKAAKLYMETKKGNQALNTAVKLIKYYGGRETVDGAYYLLGKLFEKDPTLMDIEISRKIYKAFLKKASSGDPLFAKSPLLKRVESDLKHIDKNYFKLEN